MLVLSRLIGEEIIINGNIRVMLIQAQNGKARIGIEAPAGVRVHRAEIEDIIKQQERMDAFNKTLHPQPERNSRRPDPPDLPVESSRQS